MSAEKIIVLGTRGSDLALAQARMAEAALREKCRLKARIEIIKTQGDVIPLRSARGDGRKGLFTAELERALFDHRIDVAVHSAKDLPSEMDARLTIAAVLSRGAVHDLLVTKGRTQLASLPNNARLATSSVRRQRQLHWVRPDFTVCDLRGNVPTRLAKFHASGWHGIVLAAAGLERLNLSGSQFRFQQHEFFCEPLPVDIFVPAGGQGVIALQTRVEDAEACSAANESWTRQCLSAEREFLRLLQGNCNLPVGAHARVVNGEIELRAQLFGDEAAPKMGTATGLEPLEIARAVFETIRQVGSTEPRFTEPAR